MHLPPYLIFRCHIDNYPECLSQNLHIYTHYATLLQAFERYLNVCYPLRCRLLCQPHKYYVVVVLTAIVAFTALLLAPILSYVKLDVLEFNGKQLTSCVTPIPDQLLVTFICYMLLFGYVCPAIVIAFCYTRLVRYIRNRFRKRVNSNGMSNTGTMKGTSKVVTTVGTIERAHKSAVHQVWLFYD